MHECLLKMTMTVYDEESPVCILVLYPQSSFRITMADIKLSYFDARGRAELSRMILAYAGVRFLHIFCCHSSCMRGWKHDPCH